MGVTVLVALLAESVDRNVNGAVKKGQVYCRSPCGERG